MLCGRWGLADAEAEEMVVDATSQQMERD